MPPFVVTWTMYTEDAGNAVDATKLIAGQFFQSRIAEGEPDTACVFIVTDSKGKSVQIDLAAVAAQENEKSHSGSC
jgi:hypothetical protein